uniref:Putative la protein 1 n=1 Tax=Davidia involucrata TaxID=16924 RepID=A0A5B6Z2L5_DAVIN
MSKLDIEQSEFVYLMSDLVRGYMVNSVRLPRHVADKRLFCGTSLIEFSTEDDAVKVLNESLVDAGIELELKLEKDFDAERAKQAEVVENSCFQVGSNHKNISNAEANMSTGDSAEENGSPEPASDNVDVQKTDGGPDSTENVSEAAENKVSNDTKDDEDDPGENVEESVEKVDVKTGFESEGKETEDGDKYLDSSIQTGENKAKGNERLTAAVYKNKDIVSREDLKGVFQKFGTVKMDSQGDAYYTNLFYGGSNLDNQFEMESSNQAGQYFNQPVDFSIESSQIPAQIGSTTKKGLRTRNFTTEEDNLLVSAWLNISLDVVHANEQNSKTYWQRIYEYFHKFKKFTSNRSSISLMNRWSTIKLAVNKFCGCHAHIEAKRQSGVSEQDKILQAKLMYQEMHHASFQFEHCWNELRYQPKWLEVGQKKKARKSSSVSPCASSHSTPDSINLGENDAQGDVFLDLERPLGRKAKKEPFKRQRNKERVDDNSIVVSIKEMKVEKEQINDKMEFLERTYFQEQKRLSIMQMQLRMEQQKEEEKIMSVDTTNMPPFQAEYYKHCQKEILDKVGGTIMQMQLRMEQQKEEERIMSVDTTDMPPLQAKYYKHRQKEILDKLGGCIFRE